MKKTIKQWLNELEEPYRTQALNNYDGEIETALSLEIAITLAFVWRESPEGQDYWNVVHSYCQQLRAKRIIKKNNSFMRKQIKERDLKQGMIVSDSPQGYETIETVLRFLERKDGFILFEYVSGGKHYYEINGIIELAEDPELEWDLIEG